MQVITRYMHYVGAQCYYIRLNAYEGQLPTHYHAPPRGITRVSTQPRLYGRGLSGSCE